MRHAVRIVGVAAALASSQLAALGLGDMKLYSGVNEPLRAEIKLISVGGLDKEQVLVKLASREDFDRANVEREFFLTNLRYDVDLDGRGGGVVRVSTTEPVREPYLNFLLEAKWPTGRLVREYTLLMDLPAYKQSAPTPVVQASPTQQPRISAPTPAPTPLPVPQPAPRYTPPSTPAPAVSGDIPSIPPGRRAAPRPSAASSSAVPSVPSRRAPSAPVERYDQVGSYTVRNGDTLWEIAQRTRPASDVDENQMMLALQQANPNAFVGGNINRLKAGQVLTVPDASQARGTRRQDARVEVARQYREWRGNNQGRPIDARANANADVAASTRDDGTLSLSASGGSGINDDAGGSAEVRSLRAQLAEITAKYESASLENEGLDGRVQELLAQMEELENKLEIRNSQMAKIQSQGLINEGDLVEFEAEPEAAVTPDTEGESEVNAVEEDGIGASDAADLLGAEEPFVTDDPLAELVAEEPQPIAEAEPKPEPAPAPVVRPAPVESKSWLDSLLSPTILSVLGGLLIAGLGWLFFSRRRKAKLEEEEYEDYGEITEEATAGAVLEDEHEPVVEDTVGAYAGDEYDEQVFDEVDDPVEEAEMGDPIAEADIYVAYGRYPQAVELLNRAIEREPHRSDLVSKLVEVHSASGDREAAERELARLEAMGGAPAQSTEMEVPADYSEAPDVMDEFRGTLDDGDDAFDFDDEVADVAEENIFDGPADDDEQGSGIPGAGIVAGVAAGAAGVAAAGSDKVKDFLGGGDDELEVAAELPELDDAETDFDLGLELDANAGADVGLDAGTDVDLDAGDVREAFAEGNQLQDENFDLGGLDDDLELDSELEELDLDMDMDDDFNDLLADSELQEVSTAVPENAANESMVAELDIDEDLLDESIVAEDLELGELSADLGVMDTQGAVQDNAAVEPINQDENLTKLDLARAYIDMGDTAGARDILGEVMDEGSALDKQQAKELLSRIA